MYVHILKRSNHGGGSVQLAVLLVIDALLIGSLAYIALSGHFDDLLIWCSDWLANLLT